MGVTVESSDYKHRIDYLRYTSSHIKFLSLEPLLNDIGELDLNEIDWVIVGGESGPGARPMKVEWVRNIREQCLAQDVPFFFKQWGGINKKKAGRLLDGRTWDKMPVAIHDIIEPFSLHEIQLNKGDTFYTFSDGFADQFGGPHRKKFLAKNFRNLLLTLQDLSMIEQGNRLDEVFTDYRKDVEQVDDVVVIGVKA